MGRLTLALLVGALAATPTAAEPKVDVHGLVIGQEGARFLKGVPTMDLQQQLGAVQIRPRGFHNNRPVFDIAFYNGAGEPANIAPEAISVMVNGTPLRIFSVRELESQAKSKAAWTRFALALAGGFGSASAASQRSTYSSTFSSPYGTYRLHSSYPSLAGQLRANRIEQDTAWNMAAVQHQLDRTLEVIGDHVVQRTTIDPGSTYAGMIVLDKLKKGSPPFDVRFTVDWNGERYPFAFLIQRQGRAVPEPYQAKLAIHAKPKALPAFNPVRTASLTGAAAAPAPQKRESILIREGLMKVPADTESGYCLKAPSLYQGTGSPRSPLISKALPRC